MSKLGDAEPSAAELPREFFDPEAVPRSGGLRKEHTVVPGVYFTPGVTDAGSATNLSAQPGADNGAVERPYTDVATLNRDELVLQEREVAKNVAKLKDSNGEMLQFDPDGKDPDLVQAIKENEGVILRSEERLDIMRRRLKYLDPSDHSAS